MPALPYPNLTAKIKQSNKTYSAVHAATSAVYQTPKKAGIIAMGGINNVTLLILSAIAAAGANCTVGAVMQFALALHLGVTQVVAGVLSKQSDAIDAILKKLI